MRTIIFSSDVEQNAREAIPQILDHLEGIQEPNFSARTFAISHRVQEDVVVLGISLVSREDCPNYPLGVIEIEVGHEVGIGRIEELIRPALENLLRRELG